MTPSQALGSYDFDLHGVVGVRLLDATDADLSTVTRQLGPLRAELDRDPDLTVRFVDRATDRPLTYVAVGESGFNEDGFFLLQGSHGVRARARVPFDGLGGSPEILCERAMPDVPHLLAMVNLTALAKGVLPLHASAFRIGARTVLVTGWSKSGKTESLLAALGSGAGYVGDEWIYLTPDGQLFGVPEPIRVWAWHLDQLPELWEARTGTERRRLRGWRLAARLAAGIAAHEELPGAALARRAAPILSRQACVRIPPEQLFGERMQATAALDSVVLLLSHDGADTTVSAAGPTEVSERMSASLAEEREPFMAHYRQFRFAFPDCRSAVVDSAVRREAELLRALFDERPAAKVAHPYPCDLKALGDAVWAAATTLGSRSGQENGVLAP